MRDGDAFRVILQQPASNVPITDVGAEPAKDAVLLGYLLEVCLLCLPASTCEAFCWVGAYIRGNRAPYVAAHDVW